MKWGQKTSEHDRQFAVHRLEDLTWMADTEESAYGAARRLGISYSALEVWCRRHEPTLWTRLAARDPHDPNFHGRRRSEWRAS